MTTEPLWDGLLAATVVACLVWLANALLRGGSAVPRNWLWRGALLAFWVLPLLSLAVASMGPHFQYTVAVPVEMPAPTAFGPAAPPLPDPQPPARAAAALPVEAPPPAPLPSVDWWQLALALWALGAALGLMRLVRRRGAGRSLLATASPGDPALCDAIAHLAQQVDLRAGPQVYVTDAAHVPMVCGLRRMALVLPASASAAGGAIVVLHELAHIRRADL